jgi:hypothetical protein
LSGLEHQHVLHHLFGRSPEALVESVYVVEALVDQHEADNLDVRLVDGTARSGRGCRDARDEKDDVVIHWKNISSSSCACNSISVNCLIM